MRTFDPGPPDDQAFCDCGALAVLMVDTWPYCLACACASGNDCCDDDDHCGCLTPSTFGADPTKGGVL